MGTPMTRIDTLWLVALAADLAQLNPQNIAILLFAVCVASLCLALARWSHPGGPAWGRTAAWTSDGGMANPIPGPRGLPFLGSMDLMSGLAHRKLASAAKGSRSRRLMAFSLGETRVVITCHPDVAKEMLNSSSFADRPVKESAYGLLFHRAIGFAPYGAYWRTLRRIAATHLFCPRQIASSESRRHELASQMVSLIAGSAGARFRPRDILKRASLSSMMSSVFGREYGLRSGTDEADQLKELVEEGYEMLGKLNWSDHVHWLAGLDLQKVRFRCSRLVPKVNEFVGRIIREHRDDVGHQRDHCQKGPDFVDVLLSLEGPDKLADSDMIAVLWEMIFRGTDTVAVLIEWILARLVLHPEVQSKAHDELDRVVGRSRPLTESDLQSLVYLPAVVKEVLRLHPPGPLLSWARLAITDTSVDGHPIPAGTTAMVNMWAIARDPEVWDDPESFKPERFVPGDAGVEFSVFGSDLRLAPFGSGRRVCPGKALGMTTVSYWVARLLHEFDWVQTGQDHVDLSEVLKLSCEMAQPLMVKVKPRLK